MEKVHGKQLDAKALKGVRFSIPLQEGFSMTVIGGKLELSLPSSALGALTTQARSLPPPSRYISISQEADRLGISERTLRTYMHEI